MAARGRPEAIDPDPENPITPAQPRGRVGTKGNLELVTKGEILEGEIAARSKPNEEALEAKEEEFEHPAG